MRRGLLATALLLLAAPAAFSANTVKLPAGNLAIGKGEVSAKGTYSADPGWKATGVELIVAPPAGGLGGLESGKVTAPPLSTWGDLTAKGLPAGSYHIVVIVTFKKGLEEQMICTPRVTLYVP